MQPSPLCKSSQNERPRVYTSLTDQGIYEHEYQFLSESTV